MTIPVTATHTNTAFVSGKVCTDVPNGHLHVRLSPGERSESLGYLDEGEPVEIAMVNGKLESKNRPGQRLMGVPVSPLSGWVNARYICEVEK